MFVEHPYWPALSIRHSVRCSIIPRGVPFMRTTLPSVLVLKTNQFLTRSLTLQRYHIPATCSAQVRPTVEVRCPVISVGCDCALVSVRWRKAIGQCGPQVTRCSLCPKTLDRGIGHASLRREAIVSMAVSSTWLTL